MLANKGLKGDSAFITPVFVKLLYDAPPPLETLMQELQNYQGAAGASISIPMQEKIHQYEQAVYWHGIADWISFKFKGQDIPLFFDTIFGSVREGQIWRLFTPALLHGNFIHILFNMIWLWMLGRQVEERIGAMRTLLLTLVIGVIANTGQYLIGGPFFLGYSGIVMGLAGFIWIREKIAPWEGYPLQKSVFSFLVFYILAMFVLQIGSFMMWLFGSITLFSNIANMAHVIGALVGIILGRLSFFEARARVV